MFNIDIETWSTCGGTIKVNICIEEPAAIDRALARADQNVVSTFRGVRLNSHVNGLNNHGIAGNGFLLPVCFMDRLIFRYKVLLDLFQAVTGPRLFSRPGSCLGAGEDT